MKHIIKTFFFLPFIFWNCATNVPISTSLNDFAMMGINSSETPVSFDVKNELKPQPNVETGVLKPYNKDKKGIRTDMFGYKLAPQNVFKTMFSEFIPEIIVPPLSTVSYLSVVVLKLTLGTL